MYTEHAGGTATCKTKGECAICGAEYLADHDFSVPDYKYVDDMKCATYCANCDEISSWSYHEGGVSTCQQKSVCDICHHEYGKLADCAGGTATCTAKAKHYVQCDNCDAVSVSETVAVGGVSGHSFTDKASNVKAFGGNCPAGGFYFIQCDNCDEVSRTRAILVGEAMDHAYTNDADTSCNHCGEFAYPGGDTLYKENGVWYHVVNREKVTDTTLVKFNGKWRYVEDGVLSTETTLVKYNGKWRYVKNGILSTETTLVEYNGRWLYVKNGILDASFTGKLLYNGTYVTIRNGIKI